MKLKFNKRFLLLTLFYIIIAFTAFIFLRDPRSPIAQSEIGHIFSYFFNLNKIKIKISEQIDKNKITITWNDMDIFKNGKHLPINDDMRYYYGINIFKIFYNGDLVYSKCQYKYNNWYYYMYKFGIEQKNGKIECDLILYGPYQPCECP